MEIIEQNPKNPSSTSIKSFFTCEICIEPVPLNRKFKNQYCSDDHPFCTLCIASYIRVKVEDDSTPEIKCPGFECNVFLDVLSCRSILTPKVFVKWCDLLCISTLFQASSEGGFAHGRAYCPQRDCSELVVNECERSSSTSWITKSNCPNCKNMFCFNCMVPWRENHQCCRNRNGMITVDVERNDVLFVDMVKRKKWTRCPTCNRYVERSSGCSFITCRCKTKFCYVCGNKSGACVCKMEQLVQRCVQIFVCHAMRCCARICACLFIILFILTLIIVLSLKLKR